MKPEFSVQIDVTCLFAPLQFDIVVDGHKYYARYRHETWRIDSVSEDGTHTALHSGHADYLTTYDLMCIALKHISRDRSYGWDV